MLSEIVTQQGIHMGLKDALKKTLLSGKRQGLLWIPRQAECGCVVNGEKKHNRRHRLDNAPDE